jgi:hypothetical protein
MKENFVTVFDSLFLPQGLALYFSMERVITNYVLWIVCVDKKTYDVLLSLSLSNVRLIDLELVETEELIKIKPTRSKGEYCWTLTPFAPKFVFDIDTSILKVTYIDADLWFLKNPSEIFKEFDQTGKSVLITDHAFSPELDSSMASGQFCVQFMTFNNYEGEIVRKWWEKRCIEWCFNRIEDGKFGDQKYLDKWPQIFQNEVHILNNKELALAPWNAFRFPFGNAVFYHFHGLRIISKNRVNLGEYAVPTTVLNNVYIPYLNDLNKAIEILTSVGVIIQSQTKHLNFYRKIKIFLNRLLKKLKPYFLFTLKLNND